MADLNPWYVQYPLADLGADPRKVQADVAGVVKQYEEAKKAQEPEEVTDEQLEKFEVDIKEWESTQGFREVNKRMGDIRKHYMALRQRGINLDNPRTEKEAAFAKAIQNEFTEVQGLADMYKKSEETHDDIMSYIKEQRRLDKKDRTIDVDKALSDLTAIELGEQGIRTKNRMLNEFSYTTKAEPFDLLKKYSERFKQVTTGTQSYKDVRYDPDTGNIIEESVAGISDVNLRKAHEKIMKTVPEHELKQYRAEYDADPYKGEISFEDYTFEKYSPISLKKRAKIEKPKGAMGTGPIVDKQGEVIWTTTIAERKDPFYGEDAQKFKVDASLSLKPLFPKISSSVDLPITSTTFNTSTGELEKDFVGENLPSLPLYVDFQAVALEDIRLHKIQTPFGGVGSYIIPEGEKITLDKKLFIDRANKKAGKILYDYESVPYLIKNTQFKQREVSDEYDIKSFGRSNAVPYFDIKDRLIGIPGFKSYADAISKMYNYLNNIEPIFEEKLDEEGDL